MKARNKPVATKAKRKTVAGVAANAKIVVSAKIFGANSAAGEHITEVREINDHHIMVITNDCVYIVTY